MSTTRIDDSSSLGIIRQESPPSSTSPVLDPSTRRQARLPGSGVHVLTGSPPSSVDQGDENPSPTPPPMGGKAKYAGFGGIGGAVLAGVGTGVGVAVVKGALIGGAIGTALGPVGTIVGAVIGGFIGGAVIGLAVRWGRRPSASPQPLPVQRTIDPNLPRLKPSARQILQETPLDHTLQAEDYRRLASQQSIEPQLVHHDIIEEEDERVSELESPKPSLSPSKLVLEQSPEPEPLPKLSEAPLPKFQHSPKVNRAFAGFAPDDRRDQRSERIEREFGGKDSALARQAYFSNPGMAFRLLGDQHLANGKASGHAVNNAKVVADHALGLKQDNDPASGLSNRDLAMMRELGTIAAMVEDRARSGKGKPMDETTRTVIKQRVTAIDRHLSAITQRDQATAKLQSEFSRDFALLSKSPNVKALREARSELKRITSEFSQLAGFGSSAKRAAKQAPSVKKGREAADETTRLRATDWMRGGNVAEEARKQAITTRLNAANLQARTPGSSQRGQREEQLSERAGQLQQVIEQKQRAVLLEAQPMIEKYGAQGFDAAPELWERGGKKLNFATMQTHTKQAIHYARSTLIPDLEQTLDEW